MSINLYYINDSYIIYNTNYNIINDYYQYIVSLLHKILATNNLKINIIFGNYNYVFNNNHKTIRINLNYEHTLVHKNGRDTKGAPLGNIKDINNDNYLVRIDRYNELIKADIVIDYSIPNIINVKESNLFKNFYDKMIYISSSIYDLYYIKENRNITTLTTFININEPRRKILLELIQKKNIKHININNCFEKNKLLELYKNTKILINIHQTDHHHTFEELRVLPALQSGVIVISENSPLSDFIPYNDYIIWSDYSNILDKVIDVINNYEYYYNLIFMNTQIKKIQLDGLSINDYNNLQDKILKII